MMRRPPSPVVLASLVAVLSACGEADPGTALVREPYRGTAPEPLPCLPDLDGRIDAAEAAPTLDQEAAYIVTPPPAADGGRWDVDVAGAPTDGGGLRWDWSATAPSDRVATVVARPIGGRWFAEHFPDAAFVVPTDLDGRVLGVYSHDADALWLHGVASAEPDPPEGRTLLPYEQPVRFLVFPLSVGSAWTETGRVRNGTLRGLTPWSQDDEYAVAVSAAGELVLPDFTFEQALRVDSRVHVRPKAGLVRGYVQRQASFLFECFGEVARASAPLLEDPDDDPGPDFSAAAELRRLGWR